MKRVLVSILVLLVVCVLVVLGLAMSQPGHYRVERRATVGAPPESVFARVNDFRRWPEWSPWEKLDPAMQKTYEGPETGVGSSYAWSGNADVGRGKMTITESEPPSRVGIRLEFLAPMAAVSQTEFAFAPATGGTDVTWTMNGTNNFMAKLFTVFMDMDAMIGKDFEAGLAALDSVSSANAPPDTAAAAP